MHLAHNTNYLVNILKKTSFSRSESKTSMMQSSTIAVPKVSVPPINIVNREACDLGTRYSNSRASTDQTARRVLAQTADHEG